MTKKHYEAIAAIISRRKLYATRHGYDGIDTAQLIAIDMSEYLANENPKFNRARFLQACGMQVQKCNVIHKTIAELCECTDCEQHFIESQSQT